MMHGLKRRIGMSTLLTGALALGACSDTTGPEALDDALLMDMALVAADATLEDFGTWSQNFGFGLQSAPGDQGAGMGVPGRPGGGNGIGGAFSGTRDVTFFDENGVAQDAYDALTTESIHFVSEINGEVGRATWSASVARSRDMTISGMVGEEANRTWNGSGSEDISRSRVLEDGEERSADMTGTFSYSDVVVPIPGSENRYPISGVITRAMTAVVVNGPNGNETRTANITITFDGDSTATINVNGEEMEIDLSTREGRGPLRRRGRGGNAGG